MTRLSWTQPQCDDCWFRDVPEGLRTLLEPVRFREWERIEETCAWCGCSTTSGIYVRFDPAKVPYPAIKEE